MLKYIITTLAIVILQLPGQAQHFDPIYNTINEDSYRTWRDSGYYFIPELIEWNVLRVYGNDSDRTGIKVRFSSTDESGLMYTGSGILILRREDLPSGLTFSRNDTGNSALLIPQDLLLCPSPNAEMSMGQNDPYFPLYLSGEIKTIKNESYDPPIPMTFQLNNMRVN